MDAHCGEVSLGLYRPEAGQARATVHSYSPRPEVAGRLAFIASAMAVLGGFDTDGHASVTLPCGQWHRAAVARAFLESAKLATGEPVETRPLTVQDTRSPQRLAAVALGDGAYRIEASGVAEGERSRAAAVAAGLAKLAELEVDDDGVTVRFPCRAPHDALVGLLLPRALNVRAVLREAEEAASRGVLSAPSTGEEVT